MLACAMDGNDAILHSDDATGESDFHKQLSTSISPVRITTFLYCSIDSNELTLIRLAGEVSPRSETDTITLDEARWLWQNTSSSDLLRESFLRPMYAHTRLGSSFVYGSTSIERPAILPGARVVEGENTILLRWLTNFGDTYYPDLTRPHVYKTTSAIPLERLQMARYDRRNGVSMEWEPI